MNPHNRDAAGTDRANHDERTASEHADDLFIEGMLSYLASEGGRTARLDRAAAAIRAGEAGSRPGTFAAWIGMLGLAAAVILLIGYALIGPSRMSPASGATIVRAIDELRQPVARRFEVRVHPRGRTIDDRAAPNAVIDMRGPDQMVIRHWPPHSDDAVVVGRDADGDWAIDRDGQLIRGDVRMSLPPWSVDGRTPLVNSIDRLIEEMLDGYDIHPVSGDGESEHTRLVAHRRTSDGPTPDEVELWIGSDWIPDRIEMRWTRDDGPHRGRGGPLDSIVFERVEADAIDEAWFEPATHTK